MPGTPHTYLAPLVPHQEVSSNLHTEVGPFIKKHRLGKLLAAPTDVILSTHDVVQPDFLFISNQRFGIITRENVQGAPDLVIAIFSPVTRSRDEGTKREIYERYGVPEYWLLDSDRKTTRVTGASATGSASSPSSPPPRETCSRRPCCRGSKSGWPTSSIEGSLALSTPRGAWRPGLRGCP